jgi:hypothetical protein
VEICDARHQKPRLLYLNHDGDRLATGTDHHRLRYESPFSGWKVHKFEMRLDYAPVARSILLLCGNIFVVLATNATYFTLTENEIGRRDFSVANGNPMKGLIANPEFYYNRSVDNVDSSMHIYYIPVGKIMLDNPDVVGHDRAFDWSYVEERLAISGAENRHAVLTFAVHYPGEPLSLPGHLNHSDQVPLQ